MAAGPAAAIESTPGDQDSGFDAIPAQRLIFWLFVVLAACTALVLLWFIQVGETRMAADVAAGRLQQESLRGTMLRLRLALAGNLAAPVLVWFLLSGIGARGPARRWWFAAALPATLLAIAVVLALFVAAGAQG